MNHSVSLGKLFRVESMYMVLYCETSGRKVDFETDMFISLMVEVRKMSSIVTSVVEPMMHTLRKKIEPNLDLKKENQFLYICK